MNGQFQKGYLYSVLLGGLLGWLTLTSFQFSHRCRCRPGNACWPTEEQWDALNRSISGNLVRLRPIAHVCYEPTFKQEECHNLQTSALDSGWRASQPAALQDWIWESGFGANETCPLVNNSESFQSFPRCHQGRIPVYSALVESSVQIQKAVRFARAHNLHLVIRNTGHDGAGRSSGPDSFQIDTHRLKSITYHSKGSQLTDSTVKLGAGVLLGELYARGDRDDFIVVGGECPTVGAAGGFILGGGVSSILSHSRGLAVDNVLEFEMVTAKGELVVANRFENPELFWALRGGGGSTFGVITRVTVRAFPNPPIFIEKLSLRGARSDVGFWGLGVAAQLEALRDLNRDGIVGQFELKHRAERGSMEASLEVYHLNTTDMSSNRMNILNIALERSGLHPTFTSRSLSKLTSALRHGGDIYPDDYGILMGSVIISNTLFNSSRGPQRIADQLSQFPMAVGDMIFTSNLGGRVTEYQGLIDTAMHPAWRTSSQLLNFVRYLPEKSVEGKIRAMDDLTHVQMPMLYALDPNTRASYFNLPDPNQKYAPQVYWGKSYRRLLRIKRQWDPDDLFIVRLGVGSEHWDVEGLCKQRVGVLARIQTVLNAMAWHSE